LSQYSEPQWRNYERVAFCGCTCILLSDENI